MKTFIDRMSDVITIRKDLGQGLKGKQLAAVCCSFDSEQYPGFFMPFELSAGYFEMEYLGDYHPWIEQEQIPDQVEQLLQPLIDLLNT